MAINTARMRQVAFQVFYKDVDLGATTNGSTNIRIGQNRVAIEDAEQVRGAIKLWRAGMTAQVELQLKEVSPDVLTSVIAQGTTVDTNGSKTSVYIGNNLIEMDAFAGELLLQPAGQDISVTDDSWKFFRGITLQEIVFTGDNTTPQTVDVVFEILPDFTKSFDRQLGVHNNHEIEQGTPLGVWVAMGDQPQKPYKHLTAFDISPDQVEQAQAFELQADISTTITALLNDAALTATDKVLISDTLSVDGGIVVDDLIILDSASGAEVCLVESVNRLNATEAEYTVVRAVCGTTAAAHADDVTIEKLESPNLMRRTFDATWATDAAANVDVGNTLSSNSNNKGEISHGGSAGSANITATFATTASPNVVVTAL